MRFTLKVNLKGDEGGGGASGRWGGGAGDGVELGGRDGGEAWRWRRGWSAGVGAAGSEYLGFFLITKTILSLARDECITPPPLGR
ncbi:UNVERIFIED_CONTAM: hypothetical protein Sradi_2468500 [Sesamum radiatum]|uniref:Uncharacterized protein n=1 Tax=Sesamum radiatum TaxID=300843 RepID=A0AAW2SJN6_SESRA